MEEIFTNTACVNVGNDEYPIFFLNNVVLEFNFHSINNSMCFLLKKIKYRCCYWDSY